MQQHKNKLLLLGVIALLVVVGFGIDKQVFGKAKVVTQGTSQVHTLKTSITYQDFQAAPIVTIDGTDYRDLKLFDFPAGATLLTMNGFTTQFFNNSDTWFYPIIVNGSTNPNEFCSGLVSLIAGYITGVPARPDGSAGPGSGGGFFCNPNLSFTVLIRDTKDMVDSYTQGAADFYASYIDSVK